MGGYHIGGGPVRLTWISSSALPVQREKDERVAQKEGERKAYDSDDEGEGDLFFLFLLLLDFAMI